MVQQFDCAIVRQFESTPNDRYKRLSPKTGELEPFLRNEHLLTADEDPPNSAQGGQEGTRKYQGAVMVTLVDTCQ